jgi:hypothetical protein
MNTKHSDDALTLVELHSLLTVAGYIPGAPAHVRPDCLRIDREACRDSACDGCGRVGLTFYPYQKGPRYRAVAECPRCGTATEF